MKIFKMIYSELEEFTRYEKELLKEKEILISPDYYYNSGCCEILSDRVQELQELNAKEELEILNERLGTDTVELLLKGDIDFVLVV